MERGFIGALENAPYPNIASLRGSFQKKKEKNPKVKKSQNLR